jgi:branched-chain amino acid transport system permease protein
VTFDLLFQLFVSGITLGAIYALVALGFTTIYRASKVINFAQGEFVMLGGMTTAFLMRVVGLPYLASGVLTVAIVIVIGLALQRLVIHPLRKSSVLILLMATLGASIFISNTAGLTFGTLPQTLPPFSGMGPISLGDLPIAPQSLWVLGATFLLLGLLYLLSHRTFIGRAMEASSTEPLGADLVGISRNFVALLSFGVSAGVGAIAGIFITPLFFTKYNTGALLGLKGFVAAVVGGWGKNSGAVMGGFILGIIESLGVGVIASGYKDALAFLVLLIILYVRPTGILGTTDILEPKR